MLSVFQRLVPVFDLLYHPQTRHTVLRTKKCNGGFLKSVFFEKFSDRNFGGNLKQNILETRYS